METPQIKIYSVAELTSLIKSNLEGQFISIAVQGEISNYASPKSGHLYFNLKDSEAQIRCVMFRSRASLMRFKPENGLKVIVWGGITVYSPRGEYQINIEFMEPKGIGDLQLAFEQLKKKLQDEGLFDEKYKKPLPLLPTKIGVVTSPTGAAIRDIINIITRRFANVGIYIYPTSVQGDEAPLEIKKSIELANQMRIVDVLIVGRGGGSIEDLWCFNDERVARAIFKSEIPIISAVGHETDFTIADFIADLRAPTPSAAAELVIGKYDEFFEKIGNYMNSMSKNLDSKMNYFRLQLDGLLMSSGFAKPIYILGDYNGRLIELSNRLKRIIENILVLRSKTFDLSLTLLDKFKPYRIIKDEKYKLSVVTDKMKKISLFKIKDFSREFERLQQKLISLNPTNVLKRGYAIPTLVMDGSLIKTIDQVFKGDRLNLKLHDGFIFSTIDEIIKNE
jgi:exodeoxyribonuclease VII large subunit